MVGLGDVRVKLSPAMVTLLQRLELGPILWPPGNTAKALRRRRLAGYNHQGRLVIYRRGREYLARARALQRDLTAPVAQVMAAARQAPKVQNPAAPARAAGHQADPHPAPRPQGPGAGQGDAYITERTSDTGSIRSLPARWPARAGVAAAAAQGPATRKDGEGPPLKGVIPPSTTAGGRPSPKAPSIGSPEMGPERDGQGPLPVAAGGPARSIHRDHRTPGPEPLDPQSDGTGEVR
jgi:hypothetical protein